MTSDALQASDGTAEDQDDVAIDLREEAAVSNPSTIRGRIAQLAKRASEIELDGGLEVTVSPRSGFDPVHFIEDITQGQVSLAGDAYSDAQRSLDAH